MIILDNPCKYRAGAIVLFKMNPYFKMPLFRCTYEDESSSTFCSKPKNISKTKNLRHRKFGSEHFWYFRHSVAKAQHVPLKKKWIEPFFENLVQNIFITVSRRINQYLRNYRKKTDFGYTKPRSTILRSDEVWEFRYVMSGPHLLHLWIVKIQFFLNSFFSFIWLCITSVWKIQKWKTGRNFIFWYRFIRYCTEYLLYKPTGKSTNYYIFENIRETIGEECCAKIFFNYSTIFREAKHYKWTEVGYFGLVSNKAEKSRQNITAVMNGLRFTWKLVNIRVTSPSSCLEITLHARGFPFQLVYPFSEANN